LLRSRRGAASDRSHFHPHTRTRAAAHRLCANLLPLRRSRGWRRRGFAPRKAAASILFRPAPAKSSKTGKLGKRKRAAERAAFGDGAADDDGGSSLAAAGASAADAPAVLSAAELAAAAAAAASLARRPDVFLSRALRPLRAALAPLLSRVGFFEPPPAPPPGAPRAPAPAPDALAALAAAARALGDAGSHGVALFASPAAKELRRALHPLVRAVASAGGGGGGGGGGGAGEEERGLPRRASLALRARDWPAALDALRALAASRERPRLGAMQRWVRDCDLARGGGGGGSDGGDGAPGTAVRALPGGADAARAGEDGEGEDEEEDEGGAAPKAAAPARGAAGALVPGPGLALLLLDAVMRAGAPSASAARPAPGAALPTAGVLTRHPLFRAPEAGAGGGGPPLPPLPPPGVPPSALRAASRVARFTPAAARVPPAEDDVTVWATPPHAVPLRPAGAARPPARAPVPGVPGAFVLSGVLAPDEAAALVAAGEALGFARDGVDGIGALVWLADESLGGALFARVRALLPPALDGGALVGLNARWRLFRYSPGAVYRPHIDGAWPGAGADGGGALVDDAHGGRVVSRLTFLLYLNGGLGDGGATTFFTPSLERGPGHVDARGVAPSAGAALVFPHGDGRESLVHEGSAVAPGGVKYVVRTDVLYERAPRGGAAARGLGAGR